MLYGFALKELLERASLSLDPSLGKLLSTAVSDFMVVSSLQKIKHAKLLLKDVEPENQVQFV